MMFGNRLSVGTLAIAISLGALGLTGCASTSKNMKGEASCSGDAKSCSGDAKMGEDAADQGADGEKSCSGDAKSCGEGSCG